MWIELFGYLFIFAAIGNLSAQKFDCCDIAEMVFMETCTENLNYLSENIDVELKEGLIIFSCSTPMQSKIIKNFEGSLNPANESDFKTCINELNAAKRRSAHDSDYQNYMKHKRAVCKPKVDVLYIKTNKASEIYDFPLQVLNITTLKWNMHEACHSINKVIGKFENLTHLEVNYKYVDLNKCKDFSFNNALQLTDLFIYIQHSDAYVFDFTVHESFLRGLKNLEQFRLMCDTDPMQNYLKSGNRDCIINKLSAAHFEDLSNIKYMGLYNVQLDNFDWLNSRTLANNLQTLVILDTSYSKDNGKYFNDFSYFKNYKNLKFIEVAPEPNSTFWMRRNNLFPYLCSLDSCKFFEDINGVKCPTGCRCIHNPIIMDIDCVSSEKIFTALPKSFIGGASLNVYETKLSKLPDTSVYGYSSVERLHAANNLLQELTISQLPENLTFLDISNNSLKSLKPEVIKFFEQRKDTLHIYLSGNPWECECISPDFLNFVNSSKYMIRDYDKIRCNGIDVISRVDKCKFLVIIYLVICLAILFFATCAIVFWFRTSILMWLYEHGILVGWIRRKNPELGNRFDAFLAFSHKNLDLIKEYVEQLENGKYEFKLCFYQRDWLIGDSICACILQSIENSERTIVLLTKEFLDSTWGTFEFRTAIRATSMNPNKRLIIIVYPEADDLTKLDSELRIYMKYNTYLRRDDPQFWRKLFYAMPHKKLNRTKKKTQRNGNHDEV